MGVPGALFLLRARTGTDLFDRKEMSSMPDDKLAFAKMRKKLYVVSKIFDICYPMV